MVAKWMAKYLKATILKAFLYNYLKLYFPPSNFYINWSEKNLNLLQIYLKDCGKSQYFMSIF